MGDGDLNLTCLSSITKDFLIEIKNKTTTQSFDMFENIWLIISVWLISTFDWLQDSFAEWKIRFPSDKW